MAIYQKQLSNVQRNIPMAYLRWCWLILIVGCASVNNLEYKQVYEKGYRDASKEQMDIIAARFNGGDFPYFYWNQPLIQDVSIPAHVANGVFIPAHQEMVIIKPGEWKKNPAYPIQNQEINNVKSYDTLANSADITSMPGQRSK